MEDQSQKKIKFLLGLSITLLLLILLLYFYLLYLVSLFLYPVTSIFIFILTLYSIARLVIRLSIFPGSFWLWKRSIESHFCREMSSQLLEKIQDLRACIEVVLDKCSEQEKLDFIEKSIEATTSAKHMINTIIETYKTEHQRGILTSYGRSLLEALSQFQESLLACKIIIGDRSSNIWEIIDEIDNEKQWIEIVLEDYPSNASASSALASCLKLEDRLLESCGDANLFRKISRWLFDTSLGTADQMRLELETRYDCEMIEVCVKNTLIDCVLVKASESIETPTVLFCGPNAGLYEFTFYQSEWLEFYNSLGINVFLWNYRGYGRSKGSPDPESLKKDGFALIEYLRQQQKAKIFGVHGESLGGFIASYVARYSEVDFLFVDRSFARLNEVVQYSFGNWARYLLKYISRWELDASYDYLYANCYKVMSSDPNDVMINDLASLKSGVAVKLVETRGIEMAQGIKPAELDIEKYYHILTPEDTAAMLESLTELMDFIMKHIRVESTNNGLSDLTSSSSYQPLGKDIESIDDETNNLLFKVHNTIESLDSGGKTLGCVPQDSKPLLSLKLWIMVVDIWGSFIPIDTTDINGTRHKSLERIQNFSTDFKQICDDYEYSTNKNVVEICKHAKVLGKTMEKVLVYLKNQIPGFKFNGDVSPEREELTTFRHHFEYDKAGYLIPLSCGHSGRFNIQEMNLLETHLARISFLK